MARNLVGADVLGANFSDANLLARFFGARNCVGAKLFGARFFCADFFRQAFCGTGVFWPALVPADVV